MQEDKLIWTKQVKHETLRQSWELWEDSFEHWTPAEQNKYNHTRREKKIEPEKWKLNCWWLLMRNKFNKWSKMKSVEQNCEEHVKHKAEFDVFSIIVACKLHNLAACHAHWILQHLMIILLCTGELGKHDNLPTKHSHEKNFHITLVFHKPLPVLVMLRSTCWSFANLVSYQ